MNSIRADLIKTLRRLSEAAEPLVTLTFLDGIPKVTINSELCKTMAEAEESLGTAKRMQYIIQKIESC